MKKKIFAIATILSFLAIISYTTYAYYHYSDTAHNVITTNGITVKIEEWMEDENGELVEFPRDSIVIMPGATVSKIVTVRNVDARAFLRCRYECYVKDKNGNLMQLDSDRLNQIMVINDNPENAFTKVDEWFYYNEILEPGDVTEPLFTTVYFPPEMLTNEFQSAKLYIDIHVSAVQVINNADSVFDATGWAEDTGDTDAQRTGA